MFISVQQVCTNTNFGSASPTWSAAPFASPVTIHGCIAVCVSIRNITLSVTSVTDNLNSGNYTPFPGSFIQGASEGMQWFYMPNSVAGNLTITVTLGHGDVTELFWAFELAGTGITVSTDGALIGTGTATANIQLGTFNQTNGNDILLVAFREGTFMSGQPGWVSPTIGGVGPGQLQYLITTSVAPHHPAATNSAGTIGNWVGSMVAFKASADASTMTADGVTSIGSSTATLNGTIVSEDGGGNSIAWGFNYGMTSSYGNTVTITGSMDTGSFSSNITGLTAQTVYHYQSFSINPVGRGLSTDATFETQSVAVRVVQTCTTTTTGSGTSWSGTPFSKDVTQHNCIAVCVSTRTSSLPITSITDNLNSGNYTTFPNSIVTTGFASMQWFYMPNTVAGTLTITVLMGSSQANELFWAFEIGGVGIVPLGDGSLTASGSDTMTPSLGTFLQTNPNDVFLVAFRSDTFIAGTNGWTSPFVVGSGIGQVQYLVTNSVATHSPVSTQQFLSPFVGSLISFQSIVLTVSLTADGATSITATSAVLNGTITDEHGGGNSVSWGFYYGLDTNYGNSVTINGSLGTGPFSAVVTGLAPGIVYHYQAWAINSTGGGTSFDSQFTTSGIINAQPAGEVLLSGLPISKGTTTTGSVSNLFDADNTTGWTTSELNTWAGVDCGAAATITRLRYTATGASEDAAIGGTLNGSRSDPTFVNGKDVLYTISSRPSTGTLRNEVILSPGMSYRYYNAQAPTDHHFPFNDLDFIGNWTIGIYSSPVAPVMSPPYANVDFPVVVTMSTITTRASIYYTINGTTPNNTSFLYTVPIVIAASTKLQAVAYDPLLSTPYSRVSTAFFIIPSQMYSKHFFYDDSGYKLCSFEGCVIQDPVSKWWYQYGSNCDAVSGAGNALATLGINIYKSADLRNWIYTGNVAKPTPGVQIAYRHKYTYRPCVFYNSVTHLYVMWVETNIISDATAGPAVWTSPFPDGRQEWTHAVTYNASSPMADHGSTGGYGDTGFIVDPVSGQPYIIYNYNGFSVPGTTTSISPLDPANYTNTLSTGGATYPVIGEAFSMFYRGGKYFLIYSQLTGQPYNQNYYSISTSPTGTWSSPTNPFTTVSSDDPPSELSYNSQTQQVVFIPGRGPDAFYWIGQDANSGINGGFFSGVAETKLLIPITFPTSSTMNITWIKPGNWFEVYPSSTILDSPWSIDNVYPTVSGAPAPASGLTITGGVATWNNNDPNPSNLYLDMANDPSFSGIVISEILPFGATSFNIRVVGPYYRIRAVNASGTSVSNIYPPTAPIPNQPSFGSVYGNNPYYDILLKSILRVKNTEALTYPEQTTTEPYSLTHGISPANDIPPEFQNEYVKLYILSEYKYRV